MGVVAVIATIDGFASNDLTSQVMSAIQQAFPPGVPCTQLLMEAIIHLATTQWPKRGLLNQVQIEVVMGSEDDPTIKVIVNGFTAPFLTWQSRLIEMRKCLSDWLKEQEDSDVTILHQPPEWATDALNEGWLPPPAWRPGEPNTMRRGTLQ